MGDDRSEPAGPPPEMAWPSRVLVVDDAASTRVFIRAVLDGSPRFDVCGEADNGEGAILEAAVLHPDLILLDLSMPVVDGSRALAGLRQVAPDAEVILLSGMAADAVAPLLGNGVIGFVPKGLGPAEMLQRIEALVAPARPAPARPVPAAAEAPAAAPSAGRPDAVVCDDDTSSRRLVSQVLASCGVSVAAETETVQNLVAVVELSRPDLIVLDLWLEGTPGTVALPEIRQRSPESAVVVYSGHADWKADALRAGAAAFVEKPHFDQLAVEIRRLMADQ